MSNVEAVRNPRTRVTAAEVAEQIGALRKEFQDSMEFYHRELLMPYLGHVVRAVGAQQSILKRIRTWVMMLWARYQLKRLTRKFEAKKAAATATHAALPLVTAMRAKPSQRAHYAREGAPRALCGVVVDHSRPVPDGQQICCSCKRFSKRENAA